MREKIHCQKITEQEVKHLEYIFYSLKKIKICFFLFKVCVWKICSFVLRQIEPKGCSEGTLCYYNKRFRNNMNEQIKAGNPLVTNALLFYKNIGTKATTRKSSERKLIGMDWKELEFKATTQKSEIEAITQKSSEKQKCDSKSFFSLCSFFNYFKN